MPVIDSSALATSMLANHLIGGVSHPQAADTPRLLSMTLLPEMTPPKTALQCSCNDRWYPTWRGCHTKRKDGIERTEGRVAGIDFW